MDWDMNNAANCEEKPYPTIRLLNGTLKKEKTDEKSIEDDYSRDFNWTGECNAAGMRKF